MENQTSLEDYTSAWGLANLIALQMTLKAAIELNVFNIIAKSGRGAHLTSKDIVSQIPTTNPNAAESLERILRMLSVHSLLSTSLRPSRPNDKTIQERTYGLTDETLRLVPNEDGVSVSPWVIFNSEWDIVKSLYKLKDTVLEPGCLPFYKAHGVTMYEHMSNKPELSQLFNKAIGESSKINFDMLLKVYKGFEEVKELMDVGGGTGTSTAKIVSVYPHINGINFDLPNVIAQAPKYQGVKHVTGNMFESIPNAESIMLKWVLHNWDDDECKKILRNCWEALPKGGKVIVVEFAIPEELGTTREIKNLIRLDIIMMTCHGSRERTTTEFHNLAKSVGFVETKVFPILHGIYVIEFLK